MAKDQSTTDGALAAAVAARYPEHDKLRAVSAQSQVIGEFLDWLANEQHITRMRWEKTAYEESCADVPSHGVTRINGVYDHSACTRCQGTRRVTVHREDWAPDRRGIEELLADYFGVDLQRIEAEKRAMLDEMRAMQRVQGQQ